MTSERSRPSRAEPLIDGGRFLITALACWCLGWVVRLCYLLIPEGTVSTLLGVVSQALLWGSFGSVVVAIVVWLARGGARRVDDS